jgi:hypothetical protein
MAAPLVIAGQEISGAVLATAAEKAIAAKEGFDWATELWELFAGDDDIEDNQNRKEAVAASVVLQLPEDMRKDIDSSDPSTMDSIISWIRENVTEPASNLTDEMLTFRESGLILRFGEEAYGVEGRMPTLPVRDVMETTNITRNFLDGKEPTVPESAEELRLGEAQISFRCGFTALLAQSGLGKTTLLRMLGNHAVKFGKIAFVPWNERESMSYLGDKSTLVRVLDSACRQGARTILLDGLRDQMIGGRTAGERGMNVAFLMNLTQWHHAFADRGICLIATINPVVGTTSFEEQTKQIISGSANGYIALTARGEGVYSHVGNQRVEERFTFEVASSDEMAPNIREGDGPIVVPSIDASETAFPEPMYIS